MRKGLMQCFGIALFVVCSMAVLAEPAPTVHTLGAPLGQVADIDVDSSGRLLVMDYARQAVLRFDIDGRLDRLWPYDDSLQTYNYRNGSDISVRPDDKIYVAPGYAGEKTPVRLLDMDTGTCKAIEGTNWWYGVLAAADNGGFYAIVYPTGAGEGRAYYVQAYSENGRPGKRWDAPGDWRGLSVGPDGNVYVRAKENKLTIFSPQGKQLRTIDFGSQFISSGRPVIDRNGDIYFRATIRGAKGFEDVIVRIGNDGKLLGQIPGPEQTGTWPYKHYGPVVVRNGLIFTTVSTGNENTNCEIRAFTPGGQCVARYISPTPEPNLPGAIAVQEDGSCAVQQLGSRNVLLLNPDLKPYGKIAEYNVGNVVAGPDGGYYVVNHTRLLLYDKAGKEAKELIKHSEKPGKPGYLRDCVTHATCDSTGHVWVNSHEHPANQLIEFAEDGSLLRRIPVGEDLLPGEMLVDLKGYIYCNLKPDPGFLAFLPTQESIIAQYGLDFKHIRTIGKTGSGIGELRGNNGMVLDGSGRLYVADTGNSRIQVFTSSGESLGVWTGPSDKRLDHPLGVAIGPNATLWITDTYNNRIVRVPLAQFWRQISKIATPEPAPEIIVKTPLPASGKTSVTAVVIAGTDDFTGDVYVESSDRTWGLCVTLPVGAALPRGECCRLSGVLSANSRALTADSVQRLDKTRVPGPLGTANLYVGDGFRTSTRKTDLSNVCLLVRTWGRVVSVDSKTHIFVINDGSYTGETTGLAVYFGSVRRPISVLPKIGQYVAITGVSTTWIEPSGRHVPAVRIRDDADIQVLAVE